ncbi:ABC-type xenobiotic transporter [Ranunculus cassubicifolius]
MAPSSPKTPSSSSSSTFTSPASNPYQQQTPTLQNITNFIPVKLKRENYLLWSSLFIAVLNCFDLMKFIDGSSPCPVKMVKRTDSQGVETLDLNPDYLNWVRSDQTLMIWLNATISEELLPFTIGFSSSRDLWKTLHNRLATISQSHIHQLKARLQTVRKGSSSIASYLQQIKEITDALAAAGTIVEDTDLVFHILNGLSSEYDSFSTAIRVKDPPITSMFFTDSSLAKRSVSKIVSNTSPVMIPMPSTTQPNRFSNNRDNGRSNTNRSRSSNTNRNFNSPKNNQPILPSPNSDPPHLNPNNKCFSQYFSTTRNTQNCQICGKSNHIAIDCFHRMNHAYAGRQPPKKLQAMAAVSSRADNNRAPSSANWILDSGATTHLTNDSSQIDAPSPYKGSDQIQTASGDYLPISNIGQYFGDDAFTRSS